MDKSRSLAWVDENSRLVMSMILLCFPLGHLSETKTSQILRVGEEKRSADDDCLQNSFLTKFEIWNCRRNVFMFVYDDRSFVSTFVSATGTEFVSCLPEYSANVRVRVLSLFRARSQYFLWDIHILRKLSAFGDLDLHERPLHILWIVLENSPSWNQANSGSSCLSV